jgi:membrane associated rhomboid family serine protease
MFVRVDTRRRASVPWATMGLTLLCVLCFIGLLLTAEPARMALLHNWGTVPAEIFHGGQWTWRTVLAARPETLFTALVIHADWLHLTGNLVFLLIFGFAAERALGSLRFLALFTLCGALANLVGAFTLGETRAPIIGASGAVSAIVGAYLALFPRARLGLVLPLGLFWEFVRVPASALIGFWALLQVLFSLVGPEFGAVAWMVHLAGFLSGMAYAVMSRGAIARRLREA